MPHTFDAIIRAYLAASRTRVLLVSAILAVLVGVLDHEVQGISVGTFYFVPVMIAAGFLSGWQIAALAVLFTAMREISGPYHWNPDAPFRVATSFLAFLTGGLFVSEVARNRRAMADHLTTLERQIQLRQAAQEQLSILIETSPAAILILDIEGRIILANDSARQVLGFGNQPIVGQNIFKNLPALETVPPPGAGRRPLRTMLECRGFRRNGNMFLAQIWFATYASPDGPRIAAIIFDASEGLRDREGAGLASLMRTSRILMGAVSHSVRNLCAASRVAYTNLARVPSIAESEDFKALGTLIRGLESISSTELGRVSDRADSSVDLNTLFDELRVVVEPGLEDSGVELLWNVPEELPPVLGEHYGLLHAFLNVTQNSERALADSRTKKFEVGAGVHDNRVWVEFTDTAGGVRHPERLFQPFHEGSEGSGLGLYISRAIVRSFDGELRYAPAPSGSRFTFDLTPAHNLRFNATAATE